MLIYQLLETGLIPTWLIRFGIRGMLKQKIKEHSSFAFEVQHQRLMDFIRELKVSPIAIETNAANEQHYELPSHFFELVLGPRRKYSGCYWQDSHQPNYLLNSLKQAEEAMLALTCERADVQEGQRILDLGCGWGSLSLWLAEKYPKAHIMGLSNSRSQKAFIDGEARRLGFHNLEIVTANIATFEGFPDERQFDRILSIEMFEHMKNYQRLLAKISRWLTLDGKLFIHIFTHRQFAYHYENTDGSDWLTEHFFTGGTMPSDDLLLYFQDDLQIANHWRVNGQHYEKTANAWHHNMMQHRTEIWPILESTYGPNQAKIWWMRWKVFFLACAELWGFQKGEEWLVSHYLFQKMHLKNKY